MKYIKSFNENIDLWEEWEEEELDDSFMIWLKQNYPNKSKWDQIAKLNCSNSNLYSLYGIDKLFNLRYLSCRYNNLTSLEGIENLTNLKYLYCWNNNLTSLKGIENLNLRYLWCYDNDFDNREINKIKQFCDKNDIYLKI